MRKKSFATLLASLLATSAWAGVEENSHYGQYAQSPWTAKYIYHDNTDGYTPDEDWMQSSYDDSEWDEIYGPISNTSSYYYATAWPNTYSTYYIRRHFTVDDLDKDYVLAYLVDDTCEVYINGNPIYEGGGTSGFTLSDEQKGYLHTGDNVMAIKAVDNGGGDSYIDCGLICGHADFMDNDTYIVPTMTNDTDYPWTLQYNSYKSQMGSKANAVTSMAYEYEAEGPTMLVFDASVDYSNRHSLNVYDNGAKVKSVTSSSWSEYRLYLSSGKHIVEFRDSNYNYTSTDYYSKVAVRKIVNLSNLEDVILAEGSLPITLENEDTYPWTPEDGYLKSSNYNTLNTSSSIKSTVTVEKPTLLSFKYTHNDTYNGCYSAFVFLVNGQNYDVGSNTSGTVTVVLAPGTHDLEWSTRMYGYNVNYYSTISNLKLHDNWTTITTDANGQVGVAAVRAFDRLDNSELNFLKIVGPVGEAEQNDWTDLRSMTYLAGLDLSEAVFDALPNNALQNLSRLSYVVLPDNISSIGNYAFQGTQLYGIDIPSSVTSIGYQSFYQTKVRNVNFKEDSQLTTIKYAAFYGCTQLNEFLMPNTVTTLGRYNNSTSTSDASSIFWGCTRLTKISFSDALTTIPTQTCYQCTALSDVTLGSNLTSIESCAFDYCTSLTTIDFPESLRSCAGFGYCSALTEVRLPVKLTSLDSDNFGYCTSLKYIELPTYVSSYYRTFRNCTAVETVVCKSPTPPSIEYDPFWLGPSKSSITLYVPSFAVESYKLNTYWQQFGTILPMDMDLDYMRIAANLSLSSGSRWEGQPDIDLYYNGKLTVNGSDALNINHLEYYAGESTPGSMVNNTTDVVVRSISTTFPISSGTWYFFTVPYNVNLSEISHSVSGASYAIRYYDAATRAANGSGGWKDVTSDQLHPGIGYILQSNKSGNIYFPAEPETQAAFFETEAIGTVIEANEASSEAHANWNYVGNPFPCYFDIYYLDFTAPITVWTGSTYKAYSITDDSYALRPMQAFFVQKPDELENIVFAINGRQNSSSVSTKSAPARSPQNTERYLFEIELSGAAGTDATRLVLNEEKSTGYERECDAAKFMSLDEKMPQVYTFDAEGNRMAINERPRQDGRIALGVKLAAKGEYTISATRIGGELTLLDTETNTTVDLANEDYTFTVEAAAELHNRFYLCATPEISSVISIASNADATVATTAGGILINAPAGATALVANAAGICIYDGALAEGENLIPANKGVYVVRIGSKTHKVFVR